MAAPHPEYVIVKRRSSHEDEHHGGAWKIAFADFMTAMMAFFLVLWIISATDKNTKTVIARYFNPVKVEEPAKAQKGIRGSPDRDTDSPGHDPGASDADKRSSERGEKANGSGKETAPGSPSNESTPKHEGKGEMKPPDPAAPNPTMSEQELFSDPRASLDKIAGSPPPGPRLDPSAALKGYGEVGPSSDEALRDPFRPLGSDKAINAVTSNPGAPPPADAAREELQPKAETPPPARETAAQRETKAETPPAIREPAPQAQTKAETASPAHETAPQAQAKMEPPSAPDANPPAPDAVQARAAAAANLLADLKKRLNGEAEALQGPQLEVQATEEGILISLTDRQNFSMFAIGSAEPQPRVVRLMDTLAASLHNMPGTLIVRGHTDGHPYKSATYDNWRLSSARAQMAYYMLTRGGIPEKRFERIEGFADHRLKDPAHPFAAENRRIEILLREAKP